MNLSETIKQMGQPLEEKKPPFTPDTPDYAGAAKKIRDYAKKSGGIDKNDMLSIANQLDALAKKSSPKLLARTMANIGSLDTDVRDKIKELMKESNCMEALELDEAMVRGKEVFDKTFANKTQADNFAKKNGGRVKQVGRVFYVFKEANDEDEAPASPDEGSMAKTQLEFIEYAAEEIAEHIEAGKRFPEWMQNKLSQAHEKMKGLHAALGDHGDEEQMDELKKYDKNKDYQLLNRLSQKAKTGNLTPAEKSQMANAKARLRNHGFSEEVELEEDFYNVVYRDKKGKVQGEKEFDTKSAAEKYAKLGNSRDKVGGKYTVTLVRDGGMGRRNEEVEMTEEQANELFESAFEEITEAKYQVDIKGAGRETVMAKNERDAIAKAAKKMKVHSYKTPDVTVKLMEEVEEEKLSLEDTLQAIWEGKKLDPVNKKAVKKDFDDRKDKDIDNDGDVDGSDEYLHKRRQATSKAMEKDSDKAEKQQDKEVSDKEDEDKKEKVGKSGKQTKVDVNPSLDEEKGEEMTSAEMEKRDEIMKSLEKKKDDFVKKYGDRAKEVMARTAIKMAKKHA